MDEILWMSKITGLQFRRLDISVIVNLRGCLASKVCCHKVIYIERFIVNSCLSSENPKLITNFEVMRSCQSFYIKRK